MYVGFVFVCICIFQYTFETAALYAAIFIFFVFYGAGKFSVDAALSSDDE